MKLKLFVSHATDTESREMAYRVCSLIKGCQLEIVDVTDEAKLAREQRIVLTPTLVHDGHPRRRIIGKIQDARAAATYLTLPEW